MKKVIYTSLILLSLAACKKDENKGNQNEPGANNLGELTFDQSFNWSSSEKGLLEVQLKPDTTNFQIDGSTIHIVDAAGNIKDVQKVDGQTATFYFSKAQANDQAFLYFPATGDKMEITKTGMVDFDIHANLLSGIRNVINNNPGKKKNASKGKVQGVNLLGNADFEVDDFTYWWGGSYSSRADDGKWYRMDSDYTWSTEDGSKVYRAKNNKESYEGQVVSVTGGDFYNISGDYDDDAHYIIVWINSNNQPIAYETMNRSNGDFSGSGTVPLNAAYAKIYMYVEDHAWVDNINFNTDPAVSDDDNDGVANDEDDYPNDPARAYTSYFPTSGIQTLAFEDLWPAKGDFDFNDLVITNSVVYTLDANSNLVDATFEISLDAVGSGFANGLGIVFTDANRQFINSSIIGSVSGDASTDPDVTNGLIAFDHVFNDQSVYYTNNGEGPVAVPDTFSFTVTFNNNVNGLNIVPDLYIYRSNDRGIEVHLDGFAGTSAADQNYYNTVDDVNGTYSTASGLPWVIEVVTPNKTFKHPLEKVDILEAYPQFQNWAESNGSSAQTWMDSPHPDKVFEL